MNPDNRRWLAGLALMALVVGAFVGRWVFYPVVPDWSDALVLGRRVASGLCFWGGVALMWSGERPEALRSKLAVFVGAGLLGFGLMFALRPVLGDQPKTNVDPKGRTRAALATQGLKVSEMPGFSLAVPTWDIETDVQDPNGGAHIRTRAGRPQEVVHIGWAVGEMLEEADFETMIQPAIAAKGEEISSTARIPWSSELERTELHQWRVGDRGETFSMSSFRCPGDPRVVNVMTVLGADAGEAAAFTRRILESVSCEEGFEPEAPQLPHWAPTQEHTIQDETGVRYYALPGLGDVLMTVGLPAPVTSDTFSKDEEVLDMVVQTLGFNVISRDSKVGVSMGVPPRRVWSLRVDPIEESDPPTGEFDMLFSVLECDGKAHAIVFTPMDEKLPPQARELIAQPSCP